MAMPSVVVDAMPHGAGHYLEAGSRWMPSELISSILGSLREARDPGGSFGAQCAISSAMLC